MIHNALTGFATMGRPIDGSIDNFAVLASRALQCPISLISIRNPDSGQSTLRGHTGLPAEIVEAGEVPFGHQLCDLVMSRNAAIVIGDTTTHSLTRDAQAFLACGLRAYMGTPVHAPDGQAVGTLCVLSYETKAWDDLDLDTLQRLGSAVSAQLWQEEMAQQLRRSQQDLAEENSHISNLLETVASGVISFNDVGEILYANNECQEILGLSSSKVAGRMFDDIRWHIERVEGGAFPEENLPFMQVKTHGACVRDVRLAIRRPNGDRRALSVNASPSRRASDDTSVICGVSDITEQLLREEMLQEAVAKAEEASRAKSAFLTNISHEIRTPLNGIMGTADLLSDMGLSPQQQGMLDTIQTSGETLLRLINGLLDLSRIEAGKVEFEQAPCDIRKVTQHICRLHSAEAQAKGLGLMLKFAADGDAVRVADELRITQILGNLVGNALKFTPKGHVCLEVDFSDAQRMRFTVEDTGIGMTPEQVQKVFESFEQADSSITRRFGGTGLGLSIVNHLIELMDGTIRVESVLGEGTKIHVDLPMQRVATKAQSPRPAEEPRVLAKGLRVLVADDARVNRKLLEAMLTRLGAVVTLAEDGEDAVQNWQPNAFDLLILDINMPRLDGINALRCIQEKSADAQCSRPFAIAATANVHPEQKADYKQAGFMTVLEKPYRLCDLRRSIEEALALCRPDR